MRFSVIPIESVPNWKNPDELVKRLDFPFERLGSVSLLPYAVMSLLSESTWIEPDANEVLEQLKHLVNAPPEQAASILSDSSLISFADYVSFGEVIPVESSPLTLRALTALAVTPGSAAGLAIVKTAALSGPLLILATPLSIVLCAAATAAGIIVIGEALKRVGALGAAGPDKRQEEARRIKEQIEESRKRVENTIRVARPGQLEKEGPGSHSEEMIASDAHERLAKTQGRAPTKNAIKKAIRNPSRVRVAG